MSLVDCRSGAHPRSKNSVQIHFSNLTQSATSLFARWHKYKMAINDLRTLYNRLLKDIGITHLSVDEVDDAGLHHFRGYY